jgi:hypothetical protein
MPASTTSTPVAVPPNRAGLREGQVSELTVIVPLKEGGAARLSAILAAQRGRLGATAKVGSLHDLRFVFLENNTKLLFASTYDGDWETYINDFATLIPDLLDVGFSEAEGWPGITSPQVKDYIVKYQITAVHLGKGCSTRLDLSPAANQYKARLFSYCFCITRGRENAPRTSSFLNKCRRVLRNHRRRFASRYL